MISNPRALVLSCFFVAASAGGCCSHPGGAAVDLAVADLASGSPDLGRASPDFSGGSSDLGACGMSGQDCCPGPSCSVPGLVCNDTATPKCVPCGTSGQLCCSPVTCDSGLVCQNDGICRP